VEEAMRYAKRLLPGGIMEKNSKPGASTAIKRLQLLSPL